MRDQRSHKTQAPKHRRLMLPSLRRGMQRSLQVLMFYSQFHSCACCFVVNLRMARAELFCRME